MAVYAQPGTSGALVEFKPRYDNWIGGEWVPPVKGEYFENITPVTGKVFTEVARSTAEDIEAALDDLKGREFAAGRYRILDPDDPPYRGVQLPVEHWKVVVYRLDGQVRAKAFVLTQDLDDVEGAVPDFLDDFDTWLVPLELLEERTGLTFPGLREAVEPDGLRPAGPVLVTDPEQVDW